VLLYAANPLVVIELSGNLHFEAFMIFFFLLAIYLAKRRKTSQSAIAFGLSIATKLLPLMALPLLYSRLKLARSIKYYTVVGLTVGLLFLPLLGTALFQGMAESVSLYFQKFEFNASIYYIVREVGYAIKGYNIIGTAGKYLALAAFVLILGYTVLEWYKTKILPESAMWVFLIYFLLTTTLHPWYLATLVAFSVFTKYRFPAIWAGLAFLSYAGYSAQGFQEVLWITTLEYVVLFAIIIYEIYHDKRGFNKIHPASPNA